jgi:L-asparaginase
MSDRRVLLLHTGGTLGMLGSPLEPDLFANALQDSVPEIARIAKLETRIVCNVDSSDLGPPVWTELAHAIRDGRERFDGFVIVHGTDTMAFTASALAFALEGLDRPVVLTGAQRPLSALRSDARRNLADAVELATNDIPEVGICFDGLLMRGCTCVKADARSYHAFQSPGVEPLARLGVDVDIGKHVRRPTVPFVCNAAFDPGVTVLHVTPGLSPGLFASAIDGADLRGLVVVAFGSGTVPTRTNPLAPAIREAVDRGIDVIVVTPWGGRVDLGMYKNSLVLKDAGAIGGGTMRIEAAVAKLMNALGRFPNDRDARRTWLETDVAGERA